MDRGCRDKVLLAVDVSLNPHKLECLEIEWDQDSEVCRVFIDSLEDQGVDVDTCARASSHIRDLKVFDEGRCIFDFATMGLEVSSPGVERPLRQLRHFQKSLGEDVAVKLTKKLYGRRSLQGRLVEVDSEGLELFVDSELLQIPLAVLAGAHVVFPWE